MLGEIDEFYKKDDSGLIYSEDEDNYRIPDKSINQNPISNIIIRATLICDVNNYIT